MRVHMVFQQARDGTMTVTSFTEAEVTEDPERYAELLVATRDEARMASENRLASPRFGVVVANVTDSEIEKALVQGDRTTEP